MIIAVFNRFFLESNELFSLTEFNINFFERPIFYLAFIPNIPII